mgnify:CR=1 FL=1
MKINVNDLKPGMVIDYRGQYFKIVSTEHMKMGRQSGFLQAKMKNLNSGSTISNRFNGGEKDYAKKYFKPGLLKSKNLCEKEQLVGTWTVMFKDYEMSKLYFEMTPDILPNQESHFEGCEVAYVLDPTKEGTMPPSEKFPGSTPATDVP